MEHFFHVINKVYFSVQEELCDTNHVCKRLERLSYLKEISNENIISSFLVDTNHPDGKEIHCITKDAGIYIFNARTNRLVTTLIARPGQIRRYYNALNLRIPKHVLYICDLAHKHQLQGLNQK